MELQERLALINENLAEVLNPELIEKPIAEGRNPKIYWVSFAGPLKWGREYLGVFPKYTDGSFSC